MARGRGTRAGLTREDVISAAHDILVVEGFDSLTMRRIAEVLSVAPNSLYSHVRDRDDLADGVLDLELSRVTIPDAGTTQNRIELTMRSLWNSLVARPGLARHLLQRVNWSGEIARLRRETIEVFRRASASDQAAIDQVGALLAYSIGAAAMAGSMGIVSADRIFREGLSVFIDGIKLEPAPGRFTVREFPEETTYPGLPSDLRDLG